MIFFPTNRPKNSYKVTRKDNFLLGLIAWSKVGGKSSIGTM